ncbi:MAG: hypothetical protein WBM40_04010, partial [Thiohalocapsa sp.]
MNEALKARREHIDMERRVWRIPASSNTNAIRLDLKQLLPVDLAASMPSQTNRQPRTICST